jgi:hypothetical protein
MKDKKTVDKLTAIKRFRENPPESRYSQFTHKNLSGSLKKYLRVVRANMKKDRAEAEIYKNLAQFIVDCTEELDRAERNLKDILQEGEQVLFPESKEKLVKKDGKIVFQQMGNSLKEWTKAYEEQGE